VAIVVFLAVVAYLMGRTLYETPVYRANATVQLERGGSRAGLLGDLLQADVTATVDAELQIMRSYRVAEGAAERLVANDFLSEENRYRPLEVLLRTFQIVRHPHCRLEVDTQIPDPKESGGTYYFRFEGERSPDGVPRQLVVEHAIGENVQERTVVEDFETGKPFNAFRRRFTLNVEGDPTGRRFRLLLWNRKQIAGWIRGRVTAVEASRRTGVVNLGFNSEEPELARAVADALAESYVHDRKEQNRSEMDGAVLFLKGETERLQSRL
jgi:hypothetical protein